MGGGALNRLPALASRRRAVLIAATVLAIATTLSSAALSYGDIDGGAAAAPGVAMCSGYRWPVKTLTDPGASSVDMRAQTTSIEALADASPPPTGSPRTAPVETHVWQLPHVQVNGLEQEPDGDIHLVVSDAQGRTMIAEFPNAACLSGAQSAPRAAMTGARNELLAAYGPPGPGFNRASGTVSLAGVGFFDVLHGQTGVAPNGIELHPALGFTSTSCRPRR
jgi:hypothetical protein